MCEDEDEYWEDADEEAEREYYRRKLQGRVCTSYASWVVCFFVGCVLVFALGLGTGVVLGWDS